MSINELNRTSTVTAGDLMAVYRSGQGETMAAAMSTLLAYMQANLTIGGFGDFVTQYSAPAATGFNITMTDGSDDDENIHLILTPVAGYAAGTITLPPYADVVDKQELLVNCTQVVTTLTVAANGATSVIGAPTTLAANDFFRLKMDKPTGNWYRIG